MSTEIRSAPQDFKVNPPEYSFESIAQQILAADNSNEDDVLDKIADISRTQQIDPVFINTLIDALFERDGIIAVNLASRIMREAQKGEKNQDLTISPELREKIRKIFDDPNRLPIGALKIDQIENHFDRLFGYKQWTSKEFGLDKAR